MKKIVKFFIILIIILIIGLIINKNFVEKQQPAETKVEIEEKNYSSNIINGINYSSEDTNGKQYIIDAVKGEIDIKETNIIFLTDVKALIKLKNSESITIVSKYGKYNIDNYDTIFSKNVIIQYLDNQILGDYADFSLLRNNMIISKNVVYTNSENILKSDAISINIETKDTKIFMYEKNKKVNVQSLE